MMTTPKGRCIITGTSGYVGSRIKACLLQNNWIVYELRRDIEHEDPNKKYFIPYSLENEIDQAIFANINALIHCAYDFRCTKWKKISKVNVLGSLKLFSAANKARVKKLIFISTMSAFDGCKSFYGKAKLEIEREIAKYGAIMVRPGLVYGRASGGVFGALSKIVSSSSVIPLVSRGDQMLYLVHEEDLGRLMLAILTKEHDDVFKPVTAASERGMTFRNILEVIAENAGKKPRFFPIPWQLIWTASRVGEIIKLPVGFRSDSLISLVNQNRNPDFEMTRRIGVQFREFNAQTLSL